MKRMLAMLIGMLALAAFCRAEDRAPLSGRKARESYSLGYDFGSSLKRQGVEVDPAILLGGVGEGLAGTQPGMTPGEIRETLQALRDRMAIAQQQRFRELAEKNVREGAAFLAANRKREGVQTLPSGLQYRVLGEGNGPIPAVTDAVKVNYRGKLIDGREFDSSYSRGGTETVNVIGVIKGWQEALQLMKAGSRWELFIPAELAYGQRQFGSIPPGSTLLFELELLSVEEGPLDAARRAAEARERMERMAPAGPDTGASEVEP